MAEEQKYLLERKYPKFEVRRYEPCVYADVEVKSRFENAGWLGFGPLVSFIGGNNKQNSKIAMTSPVVQESGLQIPMTAPVIQQQENSSNIISFVMPAGMKLESLPIPNDSKVTLRSAPEEQVAVLRFTGRWSYGICHRKLNELVNYLHQNKLNPIGAPRFARFNPPWTPWILRRNEIQIPIEGMSVDD